MPLTAQLDGMGNNKPHFMMMLCSTLTLGACGHDVQRYADTRPVLDMQQFFDGPIKAWGVAHSRGGKALSRFEIAMLGTWDGNKGKLAEDFTFDDGTKRQRVWYIEKQADGSYVGRADDVPGEAKAAMAGSAAHWQYLIDLPVKDKTVRLRFDDWMWLVDENVLMNRITMTKFGFRVGHLSIVMQRQPGR